MGIGLELRLFAKGGAFAVTVVDADEKLPDVRLIPLDHGIPSNSSLNPTYTRKKNELHVWRRPFRGINGRSDEPGRLLRATRAWTMFQH